MLYHVDSWRDAISQGYCSYVLSQPWVFLTDTSIHFRNLAWGEAEDKSTCHIQQETWPIHLLWALEASSHNQGHAWQCLATFCWEAWGSRLVAITCESDGFASPGWCLVFGWRVAVYQGSYYIISTVTGSTNNHFSSILAQALLLEVCHLWNKHKKTSIEKVNELFDTGDGDLSHNETLH